MKKYWVLAAIGVLGIVILTLGGYFYLVESSEVVEESVSSAYTSPSLWSGVGGGVVIGVVKWFVEKIIAICVAIFMLFLGFFGVMALLMAVVGT